MINRTLLTAICLTAITAQAEITTNIIEASVSAGRFQFDNKRDVDDQTALGTALGLHFNRRWAALLEYSVQDSDLKTPAGDTDIDVQKYHLNVYRFFNSQQSLRPYATLGYGRIDFDTDLPNGDDHEYQFNAGLGLSYKLSPQWSLRGDWRRFFSTGESRDDDNLMFTLAYRFGGGEPKSPR